MTRHRVSFLVLALLTVLLVRCTEEEPGSAISISVSPRAVNLGFGQQQRFTATVLGLDDTSVRWSVPEGSSGGTIDADGLYTAPNAAGTYHVVAVSVADSSRSSSATVTVYEVETPIAVTLSPSTPRLTVGTTQQFTATVTGTANTAVTWSVTETGGGTIDTSGLYTAPNTPGTYHVVAASVVDPTKSATATVTVDAAQTVIAVSVAPSSTSLITGETKSFTATVTGTTNTAVTWSITETGGGTIDASGLYTAPDAEGTYHVVATSVADTTKKATATVSVTLPPVTISISPTTKTLTTNSTQQFTATVTGATNTAVTWSVTETGGGTIDTSGLYTAPDTEGTYHVVVTSVANPSKKATATVTVNAPEVVAVTLSPTDATLVVNGTQQFTATVTGTTNTAVTWSVTETGGGTIDTSGLYTASDTSGTYHVVATSAADPSKSATATVTVTAAIIVSVSPSSVTLVINETQQFTATVGNTSNNAVTWTVQEGSAGGTIDDTGLYTAPSTAGTYHVVATSEADSTKSATATLTVTPFPTAGLAMHFAADQLLGPTGTLPADGAVVSSWVDLSGNGRDLGQTDAVRQPVFKANGLNGLPTVVFDGSSTAGTGDYLGTAAFASALPQPLTLFFVYKSPSTSANKTLIDAPLSAGTNRVRVQATTVPTSALQLYTTTFTSPGKAKTVGTFYSVTAIFNGASTRLRANGTEETLSPNHDPGAAGMRGLLLGGRQDLNDTAFAATEFAEVLVFGRLLSDTEVGQVEAYLKARYATSP